MFCQNCGTKLAADAKFCPSCGNAVGAGNPLAAATIPPPPTTHAKEPEPRWETRTVSVKPVLEYDCIQRHEAFGWEVYSTQDVKTVETHLRGAGNTYWTSTDEEKYTKLTFRRNKNMPHYKEIAALDEEYGNAEFNIEKPDEPKVGCLTAVCYVLAVAAFIWFWFGASSDQLAAAIPGFFVFIFTALICFVIVRRKISNHNIKKQWAEENNKECRETMERCLQEVKKYID